MALGDAAASFQKQGRYFKGTGKEVIPSRGDSSSRMQDPNWTNSLGKTRESQHPSVSLTPVPDCKHQDELDRPTISAVMSTVNPAQPCSTIRQVFYREQEQEPAHHSKDIHRGCSLSGPSYRNSCALVSQSIFFPPSRYACLRIDPSPNLSRYSILTSTSLARRLYFTMVSFPASRRKRVTILNPQRPTPLPQPRIILLRQLLPFKPLPIFTPHLHKPELSSVFEILEDIEEQTLGLCCTGCPDGSVCFDEFGGVGGVHAEVDYEGELFWHCLGRVEVGDRELGLGYTGSCCRRPRLNCTAL